MASFCTSSYSTFSSPLHGNGVKAVEMIKSGQIVFDEKPLLFLQTLPNRQLLITCGECSGFLGPIQLQIDVLKKVVNRQTFHEHCGPTSESFVPCSSGCGEFYCSESCRETHWNIKGHKLLCTGKITDEEAETSPLIAYKMHAVTTNEIFLMVADLFASICVQTDALVASGVSVQDALSMCTTPLSIYVRELWWNAAVAPARQKPVAFKNTLKRLVNEAWPLIDETLCLSEKGYHTVLSAEYMSRAIGMFEQNNVGVRMQSPLATHAAGLTAGDADNKSFLEETLKIVAAMDDSGEGCGDECEEDEEQEDEEESGEEESGDEGEEEVAVTSSGDAHLDALHSLIENEGGLDNVYPPLDGTAFYRLICQINHSCEPNVIVKYALVPQKGLVAQLHALRDIAPEEEFVQSYIDQTLPFKSRQKALAEYGFQCSCRKCAAKE